MDSTGEEGVGERIARRDAEAGVEWVGDLEQGNQGGRRERGSGRMARVGVVQQLRQKWALGWWVGKVRVVG